MHIDISEQPAPGHFLVRLFIQEEQAVPPHPVFKAKKGEIWWESAEELWLGVGEAPSVDGLLRTVRLLFHQRKGEWPRTLSVDVSAFRAEQVESIVGGIILGGYDIQLFKTQKDPVSPFFGEEGALTLVTRGIVEIPEQTLTEARLTAETQCRIMDLMNAPANKMSPVDLGRWAEESGKRFGYGVKVLDKESLTHMGMNALLAVNQGSAVPPVLILAEHTPETYEKTVVIVGKGVTFDTGGISIKVSQNMHLMKSDMGGAAAALGTVELAARLQLPLRVVAVVPSTENCVDGASAKPGDVVTAYSGKTIEIIDTDAEGRVILADALCYAVRTYRPDVLIDLATLTGSVIQTLGYHVAGLFTANDDLAAGLLRAGDAAGERLWRLPLWDDYKEEIASDLADIKNHHGKPVAGAIVAAKFLEVFTEEHGAWAHLDIAGTAFGDTEFVPGKAGTAYGIKLLRRYLEALG